MRIELTFVIDCDADSAWEAIHSPAAAEELYGPILRMRTVGGWGLPERWTTGAEATVEMTVLGLFTAGRQQIRTTDEERYVDGVRVRIMRDSGRPLSGPLASLTRWDHRMAVSEAPNEPGRTLWRDRLVIEGPLARVLWPGLWLTWQWRKARILHLAPSWARSHAGPLSGTIT